MMMTWGRHGEICADSFSMLESWDANGKGNFILFICACRGVLPGARRFLIEVSPMPTPARVVAAVIRRSDRYLVCQRPAHKRHGLLWEFPGGKCEPGESDSDTACRELSEELDVETVRAGGEIFSIADLNSEFHIVFLPVEIRGEPNLKEHAALLWATLEELHTIPLAPSDAQFVSFLTTNQ